MVFNRFVLTSATPEASCFLSPSSYLLPSLPLPSAPPRCHNDWSQVTPRMERPYCPLTDRCRSEGKRCGRLPGAVSLRRLSMLRVPSETNRTGVSFRGRRRRCWSPGDKSRGYPGASPQGDRNVAFNVRALKKTTQICLTLRIFFLFLGFVSSLLLDWCQSNWTGECF